jgi:predicted transcriptional regulator/ribosomal protein L31E
MPGKRWTKAEKTSVRQQIANGTAVYRIVVENRTWASIAYLLRVLRIHWSNRWTRAQARSLIRQVVKEHQKLPEIQIENKSIAAINSKRRRLRVAGKLGVSQPVLKRRYSAAELAKLEHWGGNMRWTARQICQRGELPDRSYHSISKEMGRLGYGDPIRVERGKQAKRLKDKLRRNFEQFLLAEGRKLSSEKIAELWGLSPSTVNSYRRRLNVQLSWLEARSVSTTAEKRQRLAETRTMHLKRRWALYRERTVHKLLHLQQRLERQESPVAIRVCSRSTSRRRFAGFTRSPNSLRRL